MKQLLIVCALLASLNAWAQETVRVTGTGWTEREAVQAGFREAIEIVSGAVILSDRESKNDRLTKNSISNYSAGYVDDYKIVSSEKEGKLYKVTVDVTVRGSNLAQHKLVSGQDTANIDGNRISTAYQSYMEERGKADSLVGKIISDYPKNAFHLVQGKPVINVNHQRTAIFSVPVEISWSTRYFDALKEALAVVQDKPQYYDLSCMCYMAKDRISILTKKPNSFSYDEDIFYLRDDSIARTVQKNLGKPPRILASIVDSNNNVIYNQCFHLDQHFVETKARNLFQIRGFIKVATVVDIEMRPRSQLAKNINEADKIELSLVKDCN